MTEIRVPHALANEACVHTADPPQGNVVMKLVSKHVFNRKRHLARLSTLLAATAALWGATANAQVGVTIQENTVGFCAVEGTVDTNHTGFTGSGFANADNAV